jgi:hypothetical protein
MPQLIEDLAKLPLGAHAVSFYTSPHEAANHAAAFLAGTPKGQSAAYWVSNEALRARYLRRTGANGSSPRIGVLPDGQVSTEGGKLRPAHEVQEFLGAHPEGVTAGGETLSDHLTAENVGQHVEYEAWIDRQPHDRSRLLCPYDLRRMPADKATTLVRGLAASHSHVALSKAEEPAMRLLQLFVFPTIQSIPVAQRGDINWALSEGLVGADITGAFDVTPRGQKLIEDWSFSMTGGS